MIVDKMGQPLEVGDVVVAPVVELGKWVNKVGIITQVGDDCAGCGFTMQATVLVPTSMPCHVKPNGARLIFKGAAAINLATL